MVAPDLSEHAGVVIRRPGAKTLSVRVENIGINACKQEGHVINWVSFAAQRVISLKVIRGILKGLFDLPQPERRL